MKFTLLLICVLSVSLSNAKSASGTTTPFSVKVPTTIATYSGQTSVSSIVTADFNGDGKLDIAVFGANSSLPKVLSIFLGNGDGTFEQARNTQVLGTSGDIVQADVNADGKPDIIVFSSSYSSTGSVIREILVLLGRGDGSFQAPIHDALQDLTLGSIYLGDFNKDGKIDLMTKSEGSAGYNVYFGFGDGSFGLPVYSAFTPYLIADLNADGLLDAIALSGSSNRWLVYLGVGGGMFDSGHPMTLPFPDSQAKYFAVGDFNGDGKLDVVVSSGSTRISSIKSSYVDMTVLSGRGDGTFTPGLPFKGLGGPVLVGDLNGDGKQDIISDYSVMLGKEDGTFTAPLFLSTSLAACPYDKDFACNAGVLQIVTGDFNRDGMKDIGLLWFESPGPVVGTSILLFINDSSSDGFLNPGVLSSTGESPVGLNSLMSAYGVNLSAATESALGPPFPTMLGGIQLHVGDLLAPLLYVSPNQINYLLPQKAVSAPTWLGSYPRVGLERIGQPYVEKGIVVPIIIDSPGIFTVGSSSVPAATAVRVASDGTQTNIPVFDCTASACTAVPIDTSGDPVYLSLYLTGLGYIPGSVSCAVLGTATYAGPQGQINGLQQINLRVQKPSNSAAVSELAFSCSEVINTVLQSVVVTSNTVKIVLK